MPGTVLGLMNSTSGIKQILCPHGVFSSESNVNEVWNVKKVWNHYIYFSKVGVYFPWSSMLYIEASPYPQKPTQNHLLNFIRNIFPPCSWREKRKWRKLNVLGSLYSFSHRSEQTATARACISCLLEEGSLCLYPFLVSPFPLPSHWFTTVKFAVEKNDTCK